MVLSFRTKGLLLIGEPAAAALSALLSESASDYFSTQAGVGLVRSDVVDAGVVVLVVIPRPVTSASIRRRRRAARHHLKSMLCLIRRRKASGSVVIGEWSGFGRARANRSIVFSSGREKRARHRALSPRRHA